MSDADDKTEEPSSRKLDKAREKGQVPKSSDLPSTLVLITVIAYIWVTWDWTVQSLKEMFYILPELFKMDFHRALQTGIQVFLYDGIFKFVVPFSIGVTLAGIVGNVIQVGFMIAFEAITPNLSKINPAEGFKKIFSAKQLTTTFFSLIKTFLVALVLYFIIKIGIQELFHDLKQCNIGCQESVTAYLTRRFLIFVIPLLLVIAIADYLYQRMQFMKEQRMTKEEVKQESKDMNGDPHIKGELNHFRRELAENDIQQKIRTARLIVIDSGLAIALQYEQGVTPLPIIVAIGKGAMARKMMEIAHKENVPMNSEAGLAQALATEGKVDHYIPEGTIVKVAQAMRQAPKAK